ncbi:hypothetical protein BCR39DRAFT_111244 [Naematelia encephala]|uniref:RRM domain-containing protein n=1 Tax=Naematelia encephala TaxID=71784 RepID=A0A1Y2B6V6_9TREE|nr:hypothetical protein BCR39DRAFT_111244 [Naematelia encephala]
MSGFPPFPPAGRAYSPSQPVYPSTAPTGPPRDYQPYAYAPPSYRPFDPYLATAPRPVYSYEQPRQPYENDSYDPYQPANQEPPTMLFRPPPPFGVSPPNPPITRPPASRASSPPRRAQSTPRIEATRTPEVPELTLLTPMTTMQEAEPPTIIYSLPPSHLPLTKYVAVNGEDAMNLHRHFCRTATSVWYADGSCRAGEGWCAAVEWIIDSSQSGNKMRGCVGEGDSLDAELGGLCKAIEGFQESLRQATRDGKQVSPELIVFCESQAAIASIDTSSRPESLRFDDLWREICLDNLNAHLTLVWIPRGSELEGPVLADKIATVGASNSYLKKMKERALPENYRRPGGGEPAPPASSQGGPWQRGDADPSRRKLPFDRPQPPSIPTIKADDMSGSSHENQVSETKESSIFVTHFDMNISARDIGILFAQFGDIGGVDIYHISAEHPRFAVVTYKQSTAVSRAIKDLNGRLINLDTPFGRENVADLAAWQGCSSPLLVVASEPGRLIPNPVAAMFDGLPDWAFGTGDQKNEDADRLEVDAQMGSTPESAGRKRERELANEATLESSPAASSPHSPSPRKRTRLDLPEVQSEVDHSGNKENQHANGHEHKQTSNQSVFRSPESIGNNTADPLPASQPQLTVPLQPIEKLPGPALPPLPPFAPTLTLESPATPVVGNALTIDSHSNHSVEKDSVILPPTPKTAERPKAEDEPKRTTPQLNEAASKVALTNSAASPQEYPIKIGAKSLLQLTNLVRGSFGKVELSNWIAHACFIATDLDQARRLLKDDLYATDSAFITGRDLEQVLMQRGFSSQKINTFVTKVLNVLDGIAAAEETDGGAKEEDSSVEELEKALHGELDRYPDQTKEAVASAAKLLEYLIRGKQMQEDKRLELERRVKVLEGMVKKGDVVSKVVNYLLTEDR